MGNRLEVQWSPDAEIEYLEALEYAALRSDSWVIRLAERVTGRLAHLASFPHIGREVSRMADSVVRLTVVTPYVIHYEVRSSDILILSFRHGAQLPPGVEVPDEDEEG